MPIREGSCQNPECRMNGRKVEHFYWHSGDPLDKCERCGGDMKEAMSRFSVVFTGPITARYNNPNSDNPYSDGGHWVTEKKTPDGVPRQRYIETWDQQASYCKQEGLLNPREIGVMEAGPDGKYTNSVGNPGCEV